MNDFIKRKDVVEALYQAIRTTLTGTFTDSMSLAIAMAENIPSAEPKIIHCCDCKWWNRLEDGHPYGDCRACRSGTHTERWNIHIQRQCKFDFYCADAEPKEEKDNDE